MKININILSVLLILGLLWFFLSQMSTKNATIEELNSSYNTAMSSKNKLRGIRDSLETVLSEFRQTSLKELQSKDSILRRYKDSLLDANKLNDTYVQKLTNVQLKRQYLALLDTNSGVDVLSINDDSVFQIEPVNIRKSVVLMSERIMYKDLYNMTEIAYDTLQSTAKSLQSKITIQEEIIKVQKRELDIDSALISEQRVHIESIDKQHQEDLKKAKRRAFGIGAGTGAVALGILIILL